MDICRGRGEEIRALLDGELAANDAASLESHLASCPACRTERFEQEGAGARMSRFFSEPAPSSAARSRVAAGLGHRPRRAPAWVRPALAAACVAGTGTGLALVLWPARSPEGAPREAPGREAGEPAGDPSVADGLRARTQAVLDILAATADPDARRGIAIAFVARGEVPPGKPGWMGAGGYAGPDDPHGHLDLVAGDRDLGVPMPPVEDARAYLERLVSSARGVPPRPTVERALAIYGEIERLGDPSWQVREEATGRLLEFGPEALQALDEAAISADPETAQRASVIREAIRPAWDDRRIDLALVSLQRAGDGSEALAMYTGLCECAATGQILASLWDPFGISRTGSRAPDAILATAAAVVRLSRGAEAGRTEAAGVARRLIGFRVLSGDPAAVPYPDDAVRWDVLQVLLAGEGETGEVAAEAIEEWEGREPDAIDALRCAREALWRGLASADGAERIAAARALLHGPVAASRDGPVAGEVDFRLPDSTRPDDDRMEMDERTDRLAEPLGRRAPGAADLVRHLEARVATMEAYAAAAGGSGAPSPEETARLRALVATLGDPSWAERERAGEALLEAGTAAVPALREAAVSEDPEVRHRAAILLAALDRPAPTEAEVLEALGICATLVGEARDLAGRNDAVELLAKIRLLERRARELTARIASAPGAPAAVRDAAGAAALALAPPAPPADPAAVHEALSSSDPVRRREGALAAARLQTAQLVSAGPVPGGLVPPDPRAERWVPTEPVPGPAAAPTPLPERPDAPPSSEQRLRYAGVDGESSESLLCVLRAYACPMRGVEPDDATRRELEALLAQLADASWETRERATARILEIGPAALGAVREASGSSDPEVAHRAGLLVRALEGPDVTVDLARAALDRLQVHLGSFDAVESLAQVWCDLLRARPDAGTVSRAEEYDRTRGRRHPDPVPADAGLAQVAAAERFLVDVSGVLEPVMASAHMERSRHLSICRRIAEVSAEREGALCGAIGGQGETLLEKHRRWIHVQLREPPPEDVAEWPAWVASLAARER